MNETVTAPISDHSLNGASHFITYEEFMQNRAKKQQEKREKTGHFWKEHEQSLLEKFDPVYWQARWTVLAHRGSAEATSEHDQQLQAEKNRRNDMLGHAGLLAGTAV